MTAAGLFDSGFLMNGDAWSRTFGSVGTFEYTCTIHPEMTGTIIVTGADGEPPPPQDPPPGDDPPPPQEPNPPAPTGAISMIDNDYQPRTRTVPVGSTVSWVNEGDLPHTATAAGVFDSGILMSGESWSRTFNSVGTFDYVCTLHPEMRGTLSVVASSGDEPPPSEGEETDLLPVIEGPGEAELELSGGAAPGANVVDMIDNAYDPDVIEVAVGETVAWVNIGELPHTVTAFDESFDSGFLMSGESWAMQFDEVGVIEYFCIIHPEMVGTVSVVPVSGGGTPVSESGSVPADPDPDAETTAQPATAGVSGPAAPTEAAVVVLLFLVLLTVGFIVFLTHGIEFETSTGHATPSDDQT